MVVGLGRVVGAGRDFVVLWSPGTSSLGEIIARVLCLRAQRLLVRTLGAQRTVEAVLVARRNIEEALIGLRITGAGLTAQRVTSRAATVTIRREC